MEIVLKFRVWDLGWCIFAIALCHYNVFESIFFVVVLKLPMLHQVCLSQLAALLIEIFRIRKYALCIFLYLSSRCLDISLNLLDENFHLCIHVHLWINTIFHMWVMTFVQYCNTTKSDLVADKIFILQVSVWSTKVSNF